MRFAESGAHYVRWVLGWVDNENELVGGVVDISDQGAVLIPPK